MKLIDMAMYLIVIGIIFNVFNIGGYVFFQAGEWSFWGSAGNFAILLGAVIILYKMRKSRKNSL